MQFAANVGLSIPMTIDILGDYPLQKPFVAFKPTLLIDRFHNCSPGDRVRSRIHPNVLDSSEGLLMYSTRAPQHVWQVRIERVQGYTFNNGNMMIVSKLLQIFHPLCFTELHMRYCTLSRFFAGAQILHVEYSRKHW